MTQTRAAGRTHAEAHCLHHERVSLGACVPATTIAWSSKAPPVPVSGTAALCRPKCMAAIARSNTACAGPVSTIRQTALSTACALLQVLGRSRCSGATALLRLCGEDELAALHIDRHPTLPRALSLWHRIGSLQTRPRCGQGHAMHASKLASILQHCNNTAPEHSAQYDGCPATNNWPARVAVNTAAVRPAARTHAPHRSWSARGSRRPR